MAELSRHLVSASRDIVQPARAVGYTALAVATDERSGLEHLVTELSTRFTGLPVEQIDEEITRGLRLLVEFLDTDRGTLSEFSPDGTSFTHIASWARPGVTSYATQDVQAEIPWYHATVARGETLRFERLPDDLPGEAVPPNTLRSRMQKLGISRSARPA